MPVWPRDFQQTGCFAGPKTPVLRRGCAAPPKPEDTEKPRLDTPGPDCGAVLIPLSCLLVSHLSQLLLTLATLPPSCNPLGPAKRRASSCLLGRALVQHSHEPAVTRLRWLWDYPDWCRSRLNRDGLNQNWHRDYDH